MTREAGENPPRMWPYWRDKKGFVNALEDYYPLTLRNDPEISILFVVYKATEQKSIKDYICKIMEQRAKMDESSYDD